MSLSQLLSVILTSAVVGLASALDDLPVPEILPGQAEARFSSKIGALVPEYALPPEESISLVKVASRLIGKDVWPIRPELVSVLQSVSSKLSVAMQATVTTLILPSPLGFTTVRGLGLSEGQHLADAPCAKQCTKEVYPQPDDFSGCYACSHQQSLSKKEHADLASVEIVFTVNYTRGSLLLGGVQSTLSITCVSLFEEEGMQLRMVGSTFRLLPEAQIMAKFLPLDTVSLRYVAWEVLVELQGSNMSPFTLEKENLILGLWQLQQAGQDFRIKEAYCGRDWLGDDRLSDYFRRFLAYIGLGQMGSAQCGVTGQVPQVTPNTGHSKRVVLKFVTNHLPSSTGDKLVKVWQTKMPWLAEQLHQKGLKDVRCRLLKAREVYDETLADQFRALAGNPRKPPSVWSTVLWCLLGLLLLAALVCALSRSKKGLSSNLFPEMLQYSSGVTGDRHHLVDVPLASDGSVSLVNITISQRPDGSDWLLGKGSSGKIFRGLKNDVQQVAIKVLNQQDKQQLAEFAKEIQLLRKLSFDANIVQFYGAVLQEENAMMVLEYMAGGDLMDAIQADTQNKLRWSRKGYLLAMDIAKGLVHLHANQVIHMDLKSKNILLNKDQTLAKITDVGMSQVMASSNKGYTPGTFEYSAPEVLLGRFCNFKADIYSYGVILWEIVTHELPTRRGLRECKVPQECPAEINSLITRCLHEDVEERPSAKEVCDVILHWRVSVERNARKTRTTDDEVVRTTTRAPS